MIETYKKNGLTHVSLENKLIKVVFLPEIGGKIKELINLETGMQYLLDNQRNDLKYETEHYGDDFSKFDVSGFDDCFPTISQCVINPLKQNYSKHSFPDHGELWSRPWEYEIFMNSIGLEIKGINFEYLFKKRIFLEDNKIVIEYYLKNLSSEPLPYIWSSHPLLNVREGAKIILPGEVDKVYLNWTSDPSIGNHGDYLSWPFLSKAKKDENYSYIKGKHHNLALKCFTDKLAYGYAGIYYPDKEESMFFSFDTKDVPYIGMWLCYSGWPSDIEEKHYTVGLEPTNGRPDSLAESLKHNECSILEEQGQKRWKLEMSLWQGTPNINFFKKQNVSIDENFIIQKSIKE